jgi:thiol-disulfide isomerase/thioredoxin
MKKIILCCLPAFLCVFVNAQSSSLDLVNRNYYNNVKPQIKNKYVILDFFATWCGPCISALPHLDSLQKSLGNDIQVIVVTREPESVIADFFNSKKDLKSLSLPFLVSDTLINAAFPHKLIPHEVILNRSGAKLIETYPTALNKERLQSLIATGKASGFPVKKDRLDYARKEPLSETLKNTDMIKSQVTLAGFIPGVGGFSGVKRDAIYARYYFVNTPLIHLLMFANNKGSDDAYTIAVADSSLLITSKDPSITDHVFSYEIAVPLKTPRIEVNRLMLSDLESRFRMHTSLQPDNSILVTSLIDPIIKK